MLRAELSKSDTATAAGITVVSSSPVIGLCRKLIEAGHDLATTLEVYRANIVALRVRSIGEAAGLEINGEGSGFRPARKPDAAPPMSSKETVAVGSGAEA